ncbi:MAG: ACT domain-containing protein [Desulfobacterales bacterium]|jgi:glycine cleavage system transcriptional repressor
MEKKFIMTAFSKDRPGIVADVTEVLYEHGCNLEDSTMTNMLDEFAIILLFTGIGDGLEEKLSGDCRRLEREKGITAFIRPVEAEDKGKLAGVTTKTINVEGIDQTGIVFKISRYLANNEINIESLTSRRTTSPESGTALYFMEIKVQVPERISIEQLENGLSQVGEELNLEITLH